VSFDNFQIEAQDSEIIILACCGQIVVMKNKTNAPRVIGGGLWRFAILIWRSQLAGKAGDRMVRV
jgi:hypothetical protein